MKFISSQLLIALLLVSGGAAIAQQPMHPTLARSVREEVVSGAAKPLGNLVASEKLTISVSLPIHNHAALTSLLNRLYDPSSANYRHFLRQAEFTEQFGPTQAEYRALIDYLQASGLEIIGTSENRMAVEASGTAGQVASAFHVAMKVYQHPTENRNFYSPDRMPTVPANLNVWHIGGLDNFSIPRPLFSKAQNTTAESTCLTGSGPGGSYLPADMRAAYYGSGTLTGKGQTVALVEFGGYNIGDVTSSFDGAATATANGTNYVLTYAPAGGSTYTIPLNNVLLDQVKQASNGNDSEQDLDIAQVIGMAPGLSQVRVYIGASDETILNAIASENLANEVSISWEWAPIDPEVDDFYFEEMAAQGQSVFVSSGDYGAYSNDFPAFFPAEDDYVTAVGATTLKTAGPGGAWVSESAWPRSGGGVSLDMIPMPSWQSGIATSTNGGSGAYRNVPDVAMEGDFDNYNCNMGVCSGNYAGTSFAAPRWAAFIALANEAAAIEAQPPIGFLNPLVYSIGQSSGYSQTFHDITSGNNDYDTSVAGFYAVPGYDLVTGWGSPAGARLIQTLLPSAPQGFTLSASPASLVILPGGEGSTTITTTPYGGFSGAVALSISNLPQGITASFSPNTSTGSSVLTIEAASTTERGNYLLTLTCNSNGQSAAFYLAVQVDAPGLVITALGTAVQTEPGFAASTPLGIRDLGGFSGAATLVIASPLPQGITAILNPNTTSNNNSLAFLADGDVATNFDATVTVEAMAAGNLMGSQPVHLQVVPPSFMLGLSPQPSTVAQGSSVSMIVTPIPVGNFTAPINLSLATAPAGVTASFSPTTIEAGQTSTVTLTAEPNAAPESNGYVAILGSSGAQHWSSGFAFSVTATPTPGISVQTQSPYLVLPQGGSVTDTLTVIDVAGFDDPAQFNPLTMGPETTSSVTQTDTATGSGVLTLAAGNSAAPGWHFTSSSATATSSNSQGGSLAQGAFSLNYYVSPTIPFTMGTPGNTISITLGESTSVPIALELENGYAGDISLTSAGLPSGMTASFDTNPATSNTNLVIEADSSVLPGSHYVNVSGTANGQSLTRTIDLVVTNGPAATPTFNVALGVYTSGQQVVVADSTPGAAIYFTTDGSTPTPNSALYNEPISVSTTETIKAIATASGYSPSSVASATYTITPLPAPVISTTLPLFTNVGGTAFSLTVSGSGFTQSSIVYWGATALATHYVSSTQVTAQVPASAIAEAGTATVTIQQSGASSNGFTFEVDSATNSTATPTFSTSSATVSDGSSATYPVSLPNSATNVSVTCLNLPSGATCSYSEATGAVIINTQSSTPEGSYKVTVVFNESVPAVAGAFLFPFLVTMFGKKRCRFHTFIIFVVLSLISFSLIACGGVAVTKIGTTPQSEQVTVSSAVTMTVQ